MTLRVAVTRAAPEARNTAERVRALACEPVLAPLLTIAPRPFDASLAGVQALLFTSGNGVRAFAGASAARTCAVLTVGDASAIAAREAGFAHVFSADGDVAALAAMAQARLDPKAGKLVHISGADVAGDLLAGLRVAGFGAERRIGYEARAAMALPEGLAGPLDLVLFHSPRAAAIFVQLGAPNAAHLTAACLSPAVAAAATMSPHGPVTWARLIVAPFPREDALLHAALGG